MRPVFDYDHVRGALLVRLDVSEDYGKPPGTLYAVRGDPSETVRVRPGTLPPVFCSDIPDGELLKLVTDIGRPYEWRAFGGTWSSDPTDTIEEARKEAREMHDGTIQRRVRLTEREWEDVEGS